MASVPSCVRLMIMPAAFVVMFWGHQSAQGAILNAGTSLDEGFLFFTNANGTFTPVPKGVAGTVGPNPLGGIESLVSDVFQTNTIPVAPGEPPIFSILTYHFTGDGEASADFGQIGAGSFVDVSSATPALFFQDLGPGRAPFNAGGGVASASFEDILPITSKKGTNAKMVFTIGGSLVLCVPEKAVNCNQDIVDPTMTFGVTANGTPVGNVTIDRKGSHGPFFDPLTGQLTTSAIPISGPIDLAAEIVAQVGFVGLSGLSNPFTTAGRVDFAQTATLSAIEVFDATGNPVSDFTVSSQSGTHYPLSTPVSTPAVGVPEPGTAGLLFCGAASLAAIGCATRKRRDRGPVSSM